MRQRDAHDISLGDRDGVGFEGGIVHDAAGDCEVVDVPRDRLQVLVQDGLDDIDDTIFATWCEAADHAAVDHGE